jgi:hypothetical protein
MGSSVPAKGQVKFDEVVVTFKREHDGSYTKQTKRLTRDRQTSAVNYYKKNNPIIEEGPYVAVISGEDYDEIMSFEGINGETVNMYFKKIEVEGIEE